MNGRNFSLQPFPTAGSLPELNIKGYIKRSSNSLSISYTLLGPLEELIIPALSDRPARKNALWKETCFEFFLKQKGLGQYWEFNLSPSGHWNVYRFKAYRLGMQEEPAFTSLPFSVGKRSDAFQLALELNLDKIIPADQTINVAVSAVIKSTDSRMTYWALTHTGQQADFHLEKSFIIEL
ncbi:MAG: DOMON-like domain-containing protein [Candidatus Mariimomonas ferrooxydans]